MLDSTVFVEAESFLDLGGWVIDQQFMDEMGSPFLLAHGLGQPVADAATKVSLPAAGTYRVWVRTRDWTAPWRTADTPDARRARGTPPGRFELLIDGKRLPQTFGTDRADWHWQAGGSVHIEDAEATLGLHDLTGFEGRCDAVLLSRDAAFAPPDGGPELAALRDALLGRKPDAADAGRFDLVVAGGGIAGICAAVAAARCGLEVALIHDRPVLGGNNSSEVRVWLGGAERGDLVPRIGDVLRELEQERKAHYGPDNTADLYEDTKKLAVVEAEAGISLFLNRRVNGVEADPGRIVSLVAESIITGERLRFPGRWFADCTGDGCVGALARADLELTRAGHMGRCNLWNAADKGAPQPFPCCPWALDLSASPFPGRDAAGGTDPTKRLLQLGGWYWESGFDHDPIGEREYIRDWNFRAMYGAWDALKNADGDFPNHGLNWAAYVCGPRESRRLLGDVVLTREHLLSGHRFDDACVATGWKIDLHYPDARFCRGFDGDAFISRADFEDYPMPFYVPYRCLYSRNVANLFMAGRDVSVTHEALGSVRVMRTCGLMGEVVGLAAALCRRFDTDPRGVYQDHLEPFKELLTAG